MSQELFIFTHNLNLIDMKIWKVYEIRNSIGKVEYVGVTSRDLNARFYEHKGFASNPSPTRGLFYGRDDVNIFEVESFATKREAELFEGALKLSHGLEWTEKLGQSNGGKQSRIKNPTLKRGWAKGNSIEHQSNAGISAMSIKVACTYCDYVGNRATIGKYHNEKCKNKNQ